MSTTSAEFENFSEDDEFWLSDLETRAIDLEHELSVLREARERALANQDGLADEALMDDDLEEEVPVRPREAFRRAAGRPDRRAAGRDLDPDGHHPRARPAAGAPYGAAAAGPGAHQDAD